MNNKKEIIINILIPIILGSIIGLITKNHVFYIKSSIAPSDIVFPIVWTILYGILGYSYYVLKNEYYNFKSKILYIIQLIINLVWPIIFFKFGLFLLSFIWIILLDVLVILMLLSFYKINKKLFFINIPYILWLMFASILNYLTYIIN